MKNSELENGLYLLSSGVRRELDISIHTRSIITSCDQLLLLDDHPRTLAFIDNLGIAYTPLFDMYVANKQANIVYEDIARTVISAYEENRVVFLTDGNPLYFNRISKLIVDSAKQCSIPYYCYNAPSILDAFFVDVPLDWTEYSFEVLSASKLLERRSVLSDVTFVMQPFSALSHKITRHEKPDRQRRSIFSKLRALLVPDNSSHTSYIYRAGTGSENPILIDLSQLTNAQFYEALELGSAVMLSSRVMQEQTDVL